MSDAIAKAAYQNTMNLYVCEKCQVVRLVPDEILRSPEVQTTAVLTNINVNIEIDIPCPVCKEKLGICILTK